MRGIDHRFIPLTQALECIYNFKSAPKENVVAQSQVYRAGISMAVLSKDFLELWRYALLAYTLEIQRRQDKISARGRGELGPPTRDYVLAMRDFGIACASRAHWQDAVNYLTEAMDALKEREKLGIDVSGGSKERNQRDLFEIYYHLGMVHGHERNKLHAERGDSIDEERETAEMYLQKAFEIAKHFPVAEESKLR
jgi:tetratricopeptide (TPR) repeat protein